MRYKAYYFGNFTREESLKSNQEILSSLNRIGKMESLPKEESSQNQLFQFTPKKKTIYLEKNFNQNEINDVIMVYYQQTHLDINRYFEFKVLFSLLENFIEQTAFAVLRTE